MPSYISVIRVASHESYSVYCKKLGISITQLILKYLSNSNIFCGNDVVIENFKFRILFIIGIEVHLSNINRFPKLLKLIIELKCAFQIC